jgi:hypothetical protein
MEPSGTGGYGHVSPRFPGFGRLVPFGSVLLRSCSLLFVRLPLAYRYTMSLLCPLSLADTLARDTFKLLKVWLWTHFRWSITLAWLGG